MCIKGEEEEEAVKESRAYEIICFRVLFISQTTCELKYKIASLSLLIFLHKKILEEKHLIMNVGVVYIVTSEVVCSQLIFFSIIVPIKISMKEEYRRKRSLCLFLKYK